MRTLLFLSALLLAVGCSTQPSQPVQPVGSAYTLIGTRTSGTTRIELYATKELVVGYNDLYVRLVTTTTNATVRSAHIDVECFMDMDSLHHKTPVEACECTEPQTDDMWRIGTVFTMEGTKEAWSVHVSAHNHVTNEEVIVAIPVAVAPSANVAVIRGGQADYILCFVPPSAPTVGMNTVSYMVYRTTDHRDYTPCDNGTLTITPLMKSMGHGSSGNVQPTYRGNGRYTGAVNCIMKGLWTIETRLMMSDAVLANAEFMIDC